MRQIVDRYGAERENTGPLPFGVSLSYPSGVSSRPDILAGPLLAQLRARCCPTLLPPLASLAHALGALYVVEGSSTAERQTWQTFKAMLDRFGREWPNLQADVACGAESVFRAITAWIVPLDITIGYRS